MKLFVCFFLFLISVGFVNAGINLDKGRLEFSLEENSRTCQSISVLSSDYEGALLGRDVWAENVDEDRNLNYYTYSSSDHGISVDYIDTVSDFKESIEIEVCVEAERAGEYKGLLIYSPEAETNVVVEKGVWLFVSVFEGEEEIDTQGSSGGSSGGGGGSSKEKEVVNDRDIEVRNINAQNDNDIEEEVETESSPTPTSDQIVNEAEINERSILLPAFAILIVLVVLVIAAYNIRRKK